MKAYEFYLKEEMFYKAYEIIQYVSLLSENIEAN